MTDTRYLVHGVFWDGPPAASGTSDGGSPVLRLQQLSPGHGFSELRLDAGARLGFRVADGGKHCLGHTKVFSAVRAGACAVPGPVPGGTGQPVRALLRGGRFPADPRFPPRRPRAAGAAELPHAAALAVRGHVRPRRQQDRHGIAAPEMEPAGRAGCRGGPVRCARRGRPRGAPPGGHGHARGRTGPAGPLRRQNRGLDGPAARRTSSTN